MEVENVSDTFWLRYFLDTTSNMDAGIIQAYYIAGTWQGVTVM